MDDGDARNAWTPTMVFWNTVGTVIGGIAGTVALVIVLVQLLDK